MNTITENRSRTQEAGQTNRGFVLPAANISATQNEYLLEIDMPGVSKEGLEVTVEANELTIIGRRQVNMANGELCYCESGLADFRRVFELGPDVDSSRINAEMRNGVLRLHLPKSERAKPKQIDVQID
jgi:HSP20 family protein